MINTGPPPLTNRIMPMGEKVLLEKFINRMEAYGVYHYLDAQGLPVSISDRPLSAAMGEIPFVEMATEIFLEDADLLPEAVALLEKFRQAPKGVRGVTWTCPECAEVHEPEFGACWNCDTVKP